MDYKKLSKIADSNPRTAPDSSNFSLSQKLKKAKHRDTKLEVLEALASDKNNEVRLQPSGNSLSPVITNYLSAETDIKQS